MENHLRFDIATIGKEKKLSKMMAILFIVFLVTYLPSSIIKQFDDDYNYPKIHVICYIINWIAVVINPVIYLVSQEHYRVALALYMGVKQLDLEMKGEQNLSRVNHFQKGHFGPNCKHI